MVSGLFLILLAGYAVWLRKQAPQPQTEPATVAAAPSSQPPPSSSSPRHDGSFVAPRLAAPMDEATLMRQIRENVKSNPVLAEALAREGRQRFPDSPDSDERDALLVDALINQQRIGAARSEAYYYFDHHPQGRFREHLFYMTGVHPVPRGPEGR